MHPGHSLFANATIWFLWITSPAYCLFNRALPPRPGRPEITGFLPDIEIQTSPTVEYVESCGLRQPSSKDWEENGYKDLFNEFVDRQFGAYNTTKKQFKSFPDFMRARWAPSATPSTFSCNGKGNCGLADCNQIRPFNNSTDKEHDRQMAYYMFEMFANMDINQEVLHDSVVLSTTWIQGRSDDLVRTFTFATTIENAAKKRKATEELWTAIGVAAVLILGAGFGILGGELAVVGSVVGAGVTGTATAARASDRIAKTFTQLNPYRAALGDTYIGLQGVIMKMRDDVELVGKIEDQFSKAWSTLMNRVTEQMVDNYHVLVAGHTTDSGLHIKDVLKSADFLERPSGFDVNLQFLMKAYYFAVSVNELWAVDRAYIVDTDLEYGIPCSQDQRGPPRNKICLEERPDRVYWLYNINHSQEDDLATDQQAMVTTPRGFKGIREDPMPNEHMGITAEDIVRSSLFYHEQDLAKILGHLNMPILPGEKQRPELRNVGNVPGAFRIPICRCPGGECISSVNDNSDDGGKNYPCRCGEYLWNQRVRPELDQSMKFQKLTKFYASEDYEDYCDNHNHCHGINSMRLKFDVDKGWPKQTPDLKHPWKRCESNGHETHGKPELDA